MEFHLYVPNAFTPDNDGVNDAFHPLGAGFEGDLYTFSVFNRWGEVVFATDDPSCRGLAKTTNALAPTSCPTACTVTGWRPKGTTNWCRRCFAAR